MKSILTYALVLGLGGPALSEPMVPDAEQVTTMEGEEREASVSPNGKWLAFLSDQSGNRESQLWLLNTITGKQHILYGELPVVSPAAWRPDSSGLVFAAKQESGDTALMEISVDDGSRAHFFEFTDTGTQQMAPSFSPNGKYLAYSQLTEGPSNWDIMLYDIETNEKILLSSNSLYREVWPRFEKGGQNLLYFSRADSMGEQDEIYRVNLMTSQKTRLTFDPSHDFTPAPSPDGKMIAFISNRLGKPQLFVMPARGGDPVHVDTMGKRAGHPVWSTDSETIYVTLRDEGSTGDIYALTIGEDG